MKLDSNTYEGEMVQLRKFETKMNNLARQGYVDENGMPLFDKKK
jgi:hypothetical protein